MLFCKAITTWLALLGLAAEVSSQRTTTTTTTRQTFTKSLLVEFVGDTADMFGVRARRYWPRLGTYLKASLIATDGPDCLDLDRSYLITNVQFLYTSPPQLHAVRSVDGSHTFSVPAIVYLSCYNCDPDAIQIVGTSPAAGEERNRRQLQRGSAGSATCDPPNHDELLAEFKRYAISSRVPPLTDILAIAQTEFVDVGCSSNQPFTNFDYVLDFTVLAANPATTTEEKLADLELFAVQAYNEVNTLKWDVCDTQARIATSASIQLPPSYNTLQSIAVTVTISGICYGCYSQGCLMTTDTVYDPRYLDRPQRVELNLHYDEQEIQTTAATSTLRTSIRTDSNQDEEPYQWPAPLRYNTGSLEQDANIDEQQEKETPLFMEDTDGRESSLEIDSGSPHDRARLLQNSDYGQCMCSSYATKDRPHITDWISYFGPRAQGVIGFIQTYEERDPDVCNTCCGYSMRGPFEAITNDNIKVAKNYQLGGQKRYGEHISCWDVSQVTDFSRLFEGETDFNSPLNCWDTRKAETMENMFLNARAFNQPLDEWDTSSVRDMGHMFSGALSFDQAIGGWSVSNVETMYEMFMNAISFNQPLIGWQTESLTDTGRLFYLASSFNGELGVWDTSRVIYMDEMFAGSIFNQPLDWDVGKVVWMDSMFRDNPDFDRDIRDWDVTTANHLQFMFFNAASFKQSLCDWRFRLFFGGSRDENNQANVTKMLDGTSCERTGTDVGTIVTHFCERCV